MYGYWLGMNVIWWILWVAIIATFFVFLTPVPRARARASDDPLSILNRRYAAGEITTAEFDERRARLLETKPGREGADRSPSGTIAPPKHTDTGERLTHH